MSGDRYARSVHRGARRRRGGRQRSRPLAIVFAGLRTRYVVLSRTSLSFRLPSASPVSLALVSGKGGTRISWRSSSCAYLRSTHIRILSIIRVHINDIRITLIKYTQILTYTRIAFYVLPSVPERFFSLLSLDPAGRRLFYPPPPPPHPPSFPTGWLLNEKTRPRLRERPSWLAVCAVASRVLRSRILWHRSIYQRLFRPRRA